ncbi:unnamed protein product, partial [Ceratitis capitata]
MEPEALNPPHSHLWIRIKRHRNAVQRQRQPANAVRQTNEQQVVQVRRRQHALTRSVNKGWTNQPTNQPTKQPPTHKYYRKYGWQMVALRMPVSFALNHVCYLAAGTWIIYNNI